MTQVLLAFVGASLIITISPGPDTLLVLRNAAAGGRRAAAWTTAGILAGGLVWMVAVVAGLAALVRSSEVAYDALRYVGAAYLVYLGVRSLYGWWQSRAADKVAANLLSQGQAAIGAEAVSAGLEREPAGGPRREGSGESWWSWAQQGLATNLLNAKLGAFLLAFFPQFVLPGLSTLTGNIVLAVVFWAIALAWYSTLLLAIARLAPWLARPRVRRAIGGLSGALLVVMGVVVALGH